MFDENIGLTCITLATETRDTWTPKQIGGPMEEDGTWCVIGFNFDIHGLDDALKDLKQIKSTGRFDCRENLHYFKNPGFGVSCVFS